MSENWHIVGTIPAKVSNKIGMCGVTPIWINDNIAKHISANHKKELLQRKDTPVSFIKKVLSGFTSVYQQKDGTLVFAKESLKTAMVTYVVLEIADENFWRVKSAHVRKITELDKFDLLWAK